MNENEEVDAGAGPGSRSGSELQRGRVAGSVSGSGPGPFTYPFTGAGSRSGTPTGTSGAGQAPATFDHERMEVYQVARDFLILATSFLQRKLPRDLLEQFDRASTSILFNIGEGAGKTAKNDKQRSYEIARGSTTETATQLDLLRIRGHITVDEYQQARTLLIRVAQMLSRLCAGPRMASRR